MKFGRRAENVVLFMLLVMLMYAVKVKLGVAKTVDYYEVPKMFF